MSDFRQELEGLINRHSKENGSNTPDFILAEYIDDCLDAFDRASRNRDKWYGRDDLSAPCKLVANYLGTDPQFSIGDPGRETS